MLKFAAVIISKSKLGVLMFAMISEVVRRAFVEGRNLFCY